VIPLLLGLIITCKVYVQGVFPVLTPCQIPAFACRLGFCSCRYGLLVRLLPVGGHDFWIEGGVDAKGKDEQGERDGQ
jgi:hypothetical protein